MDTMYAFVDRTMFEDAEMKLMEIRTADDKLPFKVTPFLINLQRAGE